MSSQEAKALAVLLGESIRAHRMRLGWSMGKLGRAADLPVTTVSAFENGDNVPRIDTIWKLAAALEVNPKELIPSDRQVSIKAGKLKRAAGETSVSNRPSVQMPLDLPELPLAAGH